MLFLPRIEINGDREFCEMSRVSEDAYIVISRYYYRYGYPAYNTIEITIIDVNNSSMISGFLIGISVVVLLSIMLAVIKHKKYVLSEAGT